MAFDDDLNLAQTEETKGGFVDDLGISKEPIPKEPETSWAQTLNPVRIAREASTGLGKAAGGAIRAVEELTPNTPVVASNRAMEIITSPLKHVGLERVPQFFAENADAYRKGIGKGLEKVSVAELERKAGMERPVGGMIGKYYDTLQEEDQVKAPRGSFKAQTAGAIRSLAQNVPNIALGAATGGTTLPLVLMGAQSGAEDYQEKREAGIEPEKALAAGGINMATEIGTEKLPLEAALKAGTPYLKRLGKVLLTDPPGEIAATLVEQGVIDPATVAPNKTLGELGQDIIDTVVQTGLSDVVFAGMGHVGEKFAQRARKAGDPSSPAEDPMVTKIKDDLSFGRTTPEQAAQARDAVAEQYGGDHPVVSQINRIIVDHALPETVKDGMDMAKAVYDPMEGVAGPATVEKTSPEMPQEARKEALEGSTPEVVPSVDLTQNTTAETPIPINQEEVIQNEEGRRMQTKGTEGEITPETPTETGQSKGTREKEPEQEQAPPVSEGNILDQTEKNEPVLNHTVAGNSNFPSNGSKRPTGVEQFDRPVNVPGNVPEGAGPDTSKPHGAVHGPIISSKHLGDVLKADTLLRKGYGSLDVPSRALVHKAVLSFIHDDKVFRSVVPSIPIDVVNKLIGKKISTKHLLSNKAVFIHALATNNDLAVRGLAIDAIVRSPAISVAEIPLEDESLATSNSGTTSEARHGDVHAAATSPLNDLERPTEGQLKAGNYPKAHVKIHGLEISIENPKGSIRTGINNKGTPWASKMQANYGYIRGTKENGDGKLDVFVGDHPESERVFIINQKNPSTGKFDELKIMMGFRTPNEARAGYLANYEKGWKGIRSLVPMGIDQFKAWVKEGDTTREITKKEAEKFSGAKQTVGSELEEKKGRALFTSEELKHFDRLGIDVSGVTPEYKAEALQQIDFKKKDEGFTSEEYNEKVREEYRRQEEKRAEKAPKKKSNKSKVELKQGGKTLLRIVQEYGGILRDSAAKGYDIKTSFLEHGLFGVFRTKTGRAVDDLAKTLLSDGIIPRPEEGFHPGDWLVHLLQQERQGMAVTIENLEKLDNSLAEEEAHALQSVKEDLRAEGKTESEIAEILGEVQGDIKEESHNQEVQAVGQAGQDLEQDFIDEIDEEEYRKVTGENPAPVEDNSTPSSSELFPTSDLFTLSGNQPAQKTHFKPPEQKGERLLDVEKQSAEELRERLSGEKAKKEAQTAKPLADKTDDEQQATTDFATSFKPGDKVSWEYYGETVTGTVTEKQTGGFGQDYRKEGRVRLQSDSGHTHIIGAEKLTKMTPSEAPGIASERTGEDRRRSESDTIEAKETDKTAPMFKRLIGADINQAFSDRLDRYLEGKMGHRIAINVTDTPEVLKLLGAKSLPVVVQDSTIEKVTKGKHTVSIDTLRKLPGQLHNPIAIFDGSEKGSLVIMTELKDGDGDTVIAAVHLSQKLAHHEVNEIASVYGKERNQWFKEQINRGRLRYVNTKKASKWFQAAGLQSPLEETIKSQSVGQLNLPKEATYRSFDNRILTEKDIVKPISEDEGPETSFKLFTSEDLSTKLSKAIYPNEPIYTVDQVKAVLDPLMKKLPGGGRLEVVKDWTGFPVTWLSYFQEGDKVFGGYDVATGSVYIVADAVASPEAVQATLIHEVIGHRGIKAILAPEEYSKVMGDVYESYKNSKAIRKIAKSYALDLTKEKDRNEAADELIAHMAELGKRPPLLQRIIGVVRAALRRLIPSMKYTDTDILRMISKSWRVMEGKEAANRPGASEGLTNETSSGTVGGVTLKKGAGESTGKSLSMPEGGELIGQVSSKSFNSQNGKEYQLTSAADSLSLLSDKEFMDVTGVSKEDFQGRGGSVYFISDQAPEANSIHEISGEILLKESLFRDEKKLRSTLIHELTHWGQIERGEAPKKYYADPAESIKEYMEYLSDPAEVKARFNAEGKSEDEYDEFMEQLNWAKSDEARKLKMPEIGEVRTEVQHKWRMPLSYLEKEIQVAKKELNLPPARKKYGAYVSKSQAQRNISELENIVRAEGGSEVLALSDAAHDRLAEVQERHPISDTDVSNLNVVYGDIKREWNMRRLTRELSDSEIEYYDLPVIRMEVLGKIDPKTGKREFINPIMIESYLEEKTGIKAVAVGPNEIDIELTKTNGKRVAKLQKVLSNALPNPSRSPGEGEQTKPSFKKAVPSNSALDDILKMIDEGPGPQIPTPGKTSERRTRSWLKLNYDATVQVISHYMPGNLPHLHFLERVMKSAQWYAHPVMKQLYDIMAHKRQERYYESVNDFNDAGDGRTVSGELAALRKKDPKGYEELEKLLILADTKWVRDKSQTFKERIEKVRASDDVKRVALLIREAYDKMLDARQKSMKELVKQIEEQGYQEDAFELDQEGTKNFNRFTVRPTAEFDGFFTVSGEAKQEAYGLPTHKGINYTMGHSVAGGVEVQAINFNKDSFSEKQADEWWNDHKGHFRKAHKDVKAELRQTLLGALAIMDEWRGYYSPRLRDRKAIVVTASRVNPETGEKEFIRESASRYGQEAVKDRLLKEGYGEIKAKEAAALPETIYLNLKAVDVAKALEYAVQDMKGKMSDEAFKALNQDLIEQAVDMIRERGIEATKIHRLPSSRVVKGYIEDPLTAYLRYLSGVSGGLAKGEASREAMAALAKIDPSMEEQAYKTAKRYIEENLRNANVSDRMMALAKSVATFKYLGFNPRSALINMTAMVTSAPAAIHQYAGNRKFGMANVNAEIARAGKDYTKHMIGRKLSDPKEQAVVEWITKKGYDEPQLTRDAMTHMQGTIGKAWSKIAGAAMFMFSTTEQWNRGSTMLAAYRVAMKRLAKEGVSEEDRDAKAKQIAVEATEKAHASYGKANMPEWAMGESVAHKFGGLLYMYGNFGHNYLQLLYDLGAKKHNAMAFTWAMAAPLVLAGGAAWPFKDEFLLIINGMLRALGIREGADKFVWDQTRKYLGKEAETFGRRGITGLSGVDISGSLGIGLGLPTGLIGLMGAFGGVLEDMAKAGHFFATGQTGRGFEKFLPTVASNVIRAYREHEEGVTTEKGRRVWTEEGKPMKLTGAETTARALGFKSSRQSVMQERRNEEFRIEDQFTNKRNAIYEAARAYYSGAPDSKRFTRIMTQVAEYNRSVRQQGLEGIIPLIKGSSLRQQAKSVSVPNKKERLRLQRQY